MRFGFLTGGLALLLLPATGVRAAIVIEHSGVGCVVAGQFPRFEARFQPASDVSRARLHFRPAGGPHWYSVPMKAEGGEFAGVLPKPKKSLKQLEYYIEATDTAFGTSRTAEYKPEVASGPGACKDKLVARALSAASVLIEGPAGAPLVPVGFDPAGVIPLSGTPGASTQAPSSSGTGSTTGSSAGTGTATTAGSAAGAGGVGTKAFLIGGAVAAGAGVAVAVSKGGGSGGTGGSGSGGSGSGGSAPCQAQPITSSLSNPTSGALRCGLPLRAGIVVTNGSCSALPVQAVQLTQNATAGTFCAAALSSFSFAPAVSTVASGQTTTVLNYQSAPFCCPGGPCPGTTVCTYDETFSVLTGAGAVPTGAVSLQVSFDPTCPICPP